MNSPPCRGFADRFIILVLASALAAGLGLFAATRYFAAGQAPSQSRQAKLATVRLIEPPRTLPRFSLGASDGSVLTPDSLRGRWTVVFLGFTHCPDVCPTTLADLAKAQKDWEAIDPTMRPRVLFVSVDPERDSPRKTGEYAHYFHPDTVAASGTSAQVAGFAKAMALVYMKVPLPGGDYSMDHSSTMVVLDPEGRQAGLVSAPVDWKSIAADMRLLAGTSP